MFTLMHREFVNLKVKIKTTFQIGTHCSLAKVRN